MRSPEPALFSPYENAFLPAETLSSYAFSLCGGPCAGLFRIENGEMLKDLVQCCINASIPYRVLGGMTNILVSDEGYDGVILLNRKGSVSHTISEDGSVLLAAESGAGMAAAVRYCIENEISGLEWAAGLPGTVGGAVCGNAGAFGSDISRIFSHGEILDEKGIKQTIQKADMNFAYRSSSMKHQQNKCVLCKAVFRLEKGIKEQILAAGEANKEKRKSTQPADRHSLGSVFKNPEGESAGKLIQAAGLKGFSIGKAEVSMKHANFITTQKGVKSADYHSLVIHVQKTVYEQFGILLEPEIEMLGFGLK